MEFMALINALYERSMIHTGVDVNAGDKIMMLYTCYQNVFKGGRLVVCARQLRPGEAPQIDTSKVYYNSGARFPQAYYDEMGSVNPYYSGEQQNQPSDRPENNTQRPSDTTPSEIPTEPADAGENTSAAPEEPSSAPDGHDTSSQPVPETPPAEPPAEEANADAAVG